MYEIICLYFIIFNSWFCWPLLVKFMKFVKFFPSYHCFTSLSWIPLLLFFFLSLHARLAESSSFFFLISFLHLLFWNFSSTIDFASASALRRWPELFFPFFFNYNYIIICNYYYFISSNINIWYYFLCLMNRIIYFEIIVTNYSITLKVSVSILIIWSINCCQN